MRSMISRLHGESQHTASLPVPPSTVHLFPCMGKADFYGYRQVGVGTSATVDRTLQV